MTFAITAFYTGLLALLLLILSALVIRERGRARVSLGDGGDDRLNRAIRAQANFAEYVPMSLLLIAMTEGLGAPALAVHALGLCLLVGRVMHAIGLMTPILPGRMRAWGTAATFVVLLAGSLGLIAHTMF
jgi:uncharacterized membrane protein YecN with MAPEG domain